MSSRRKVLWDIFYSEVVSNMLSTGVYSSNKSLTEWLSLTKKRFDRDNIQQLESYVDSRLSKHHC